MQELINEFITESREGLDRVERCLIELETRPCDRLLVDEIFRAVHSIKGAAGFLGLSRLQGLAHAGEDLLASARAGTVAIRSELISSLLELLDSLRNILEIIEKTGGEGNRATDRDRETIARLRALLDASISSVPGERTAVAANLQLATPPPLPAPLSRAHDADAQDRRLVAPQLEHTVRVDVDLLNRMLGMIGELVHTQDHILRCLDGANSAARRVRSLTSELKRSMVEARLQPVGYLFGKFPRLARDTANACGKQVRIEVEGQDTKLDKLLLDAIRDPITHAVRNAIAHGIETPEERSDMGKDPEGVIHLRALYGNGSVVVEIEDDGRGICPGRIAARAVECGFLTAEKNELLTDQERIELVFTPGLSTAAKATTVCGRGVGMDVVRKNVTEVGGRVALESRPGRGTTLRLTLPLTVAVLPVFLVRSSGQSFAIPQSAVVTLVPAPAVEVSGSLGRTPEGALPTVRLSAALHLPTAPGLGPARELSMVVLESNRSPFGLMVEEFVGAREVVLKPVSAPLRNGVFSGAAILDSGELALVLDVNGLPERAQVWTGAILAPEDCRADSAPSASTDHMLTAGAA